jgi:hypothetical protein
VFELRVELAERADRTPRQPRLTSRRKSADTHRPRQQQPAAGIEDHIRFERLVVVTENPERTLRAQRMSGVIRPRQTFASNRDHGVSSEHTPMQRLAFHERQQHAIDIFGAGQQRVGIGHRVAQQLAHARREIHVQR